MIKIKETLLGVRISESLKKTVDQYCQKFGISRKYFVESAIKNKLIEIMEEDRDVYVAKERLKDSQAVGEREVEAYFSKRLKGK
jgi:predicted DNA-binding protein